MEVHHRFLFILLLLLKSSPQCSEILHAQLFSFTYMNTYLHAMYRSIQTAACQLQWFGLICNASFHLLYTYSHICGACCYRNSRKSWWQRHKRCSTGCTQRFHSWTEKCCQVTVVLTHSLLPSQDIYVCVIECVFFISFYFICKL